MSPLFEANCLTCAGVACNTCLTPYPNQLTNPNGGANLPILTASPIGDFQIADYDVTFRSRCLSAFDGASAAGTRHLVAVNELLPQRGALKQLDSEFYFDLDTRTHQ